MGPPSIWATHYGAAGAPTPCGFYRITLPLGELARHGWDARYGSGTNVPPESEQAGVFVIQGGDQRQAAAELTRRGACQRTVYETDDDRFAITAAMGDLYAWHANPANRAAIIANMRACHTVTVSTEPLAASVRAVTGHDDVRVLPNCVPDGVLDLPRQSRVRRIVIGWAAGAGRDADFAVARDAVAGALEQVKRTEMHFMGTDYRHLLPRHAPARYSHPAAVSLDWRAWFGGYDFSIAIAPLAPTLFNASRSGVKAIEAMALGIPVLAADAEPYRGIVADGVNGYLCRNSRDWARRLRELACDRDAREEMGARARETARGHVISAGWTAWASAYGGAGGVS